MDINSFDKEVPLIEELIDIADETCKLFRKKKIKGAGLYVSVNLLERTKERAESLIPLLSQFNIKDTSYGIGLLIRNLASDTLHTIHLHDLLFYKKDISKFELAANDMLNEGKNFSKTYYKTLLGFYKNDPVILQRLNDEIEEIGKAPKGKKILEILRDILDSEEQKASDRSRKLITHQAADTFMFFSKLEHFGIESIAHRLWGPLREYKTYQSHIYSTMPQQLVLLHDIIHAYNQNKKMKIRWKSAVDYRDKLVELSDSVY